MNKSDAIKFFSTQAKLAEALGMTQHAVSGWKEYPPPLRQLQIEKLTKGALKAEVSILHVSSIGKALVKASRKNPNGEKHMGLTA